MKRYFCIACGREHDGRHSSKYCQKHKWQLDKFGKLLDSNPRTKYDPNEFRFVDGHVEFDTYCYPSQGVNKTYIIDAEDYPKVSKLKWFTTSTGYAFCRNSNTLLHRFIMEGKPGQEFDHINLIFLDIRKENLRLCTSGLNKLNRRVISRDVVGVKGVWRHTNNLYSANLTIGGNLYNSPCYRTIAEAAFARYILEQLFVKEYLQQHHQDLFGTLSEETKAQIINGVKRKFNIT